MCYFEVIFAREEVVKCRNSSCQESPVTNGTQSYSFELSFSSGISIGKPP